MPFGVVSGVSRRMGVLDLGPHLARGRGGFGVFLSQWLNGVLSVFLKQKCIQLFHVKLTIFPLKNISPESLFILLS